jgi:alkylation response protein AidB-like acyl-CoA dehydrogenase
MEFQPSETVRQVKRTVDEFIEQEIRPLEDEYDHFLGEDAEMNIVDGTGSDYRMSQEYLDLWQDIRERSAEAGIYTMHMPERVGGGGLGALEATQVIEHIENRNPDGYHTLIWHTGTVTEILIHAHDDEYQREKYFEPIMSGEKLNAFALTEPDHGSDATHMETTAEKDGDEWVIDGQKAFASKGGVADFVIVHVRTSGEDGDVDGITTFLVDADNPGMSVDKLQRPAAGQPARQAILDFTNCRVSDRQVLGEVDEGFRQLIEWIGTGRLTIPAKAVGRAQWMLDASVDYANQRETFGNEIGSYQGVQYQLAELATQIEQVRWLYRVTASKADNDERIVKEQSMAKLMGAKLWNDAADVAVQVHGGAGFMRSLPFADQYAEARAARIYEGTDEIQKRTIAKELLKGR